MIRHATRNHLPRFETLESRRLLAVDVSVEHDDCCLATADPGAIAIEHHAADSRPPEPIAEPTRDLVVPVIIDPAVVDQVLAVESLDPPADNIMECVIPVDYANQDRNALANNEGMMQDPGSLPETYEALRQALGDKQLAEMLRGNKSKWGNYQGICGTGLLEMQRNYSAIYQQFLTTEKQLEGWLQGHDLQDKQPAPDSDRPPAEDGSGDQAPAPQNEESPNDDSCDQSRPEPDLFESLESMKGDMSDEEFAELLRDNMQRRGNHLGLCGFAIMEIKRLDPDAFQGLDRLERALALWLEDYDARQKDAQPTDEKEKTTPTESGDDGNGDTDEHHRPADPNDHGAESPDPNAEDKDGVASGDDAGGEQPEQDPPSGPNPQDTPSDSPNDPVNEKPTGPTADAQPKDERIKRAFEAEDVSGLRTVTIRLGGREAGVTQIDGKFYITEETSVALDPETKAPVEYWDFNKGVEIQGEMWYPIYILSLGSHPLNMFRRVVDSAETLGRAFLEKMFAEMAAKDQSVRVLEVKSENLIFLTIVVQFDRGMMSQVGDPLRAAKSHFDRAGEALKNGDWMTAWVEFEAAQGELALAALEVLPTPAGKGGRPAVRAAKQAVEPATDAVKAFTKNLSDAATETRKTAKCADSAEAASQMKRVAKQLDEMADASRRLERVSGIGRPRPGSFPVAARDKSALEAHFGKDKVQPLGNRNGDNVLVVTGSDGKQQVWVRPAGYAADGTKRAKYGDYRDAYGEAFGDIPAGFDVDHIQSQARAGQQGYGYVRLDLVNSEVNQSWGRRLEKQTVNMGRAGHVEPQGPPPIRNIDQFQWWKLQGITPEQIDQHLRRRGG